MLIRRTTEEQKEDLIALTVSLVINMGQPESTKVNSGVYFLCSWIFHVATGYLASIRTPVRISVDRNMIRDWSEEPLNQRWSKIMLGSASGQFAWKYSLVSKFGQKNLLSRVYVIV